MAFGGVALSVEYTPGRAAEIVDFLFARVPRRAGGRAPLASLRLREARDGVFRLWSQGTLRCADRNAGAVASWLLHLACRELAFGGTQGLLLHTAAVRWGRRGLLLAGASGSGKTTLTAFLTSRGFGHLTDELAFVPPRSHRIRGLAVPLKLKKPGCEVLEGHLDLRADGGAVLTGRYDLLFRPADPGPAPAGVAVAAIVFPRYTPRGRFSLTALSPAQTGARLMAGVLNAEALADHGFREVARLAGRAPGYAMSYGSLRQVDATLDRLRGLMSATPESPE
jgi:hypothetical protein